MSADNGIYILDLPAKSGEGREYRVLQAQGIENISWEGKLFPGDTEPVNGEILKDYYGKVQVVTDMAEALIVADGMVREFRHAGGPLEYGISFITLNNPWSTYCP